VPTEGTPPLAIAHDYLTQRGGAERVVLEFADAFPGAAIHTSMYDPAGTFPGFAKLDVRTGALDRVAYLRHHHRAALPLLAPWFLTHKIDAEVVLASSSGWAHEVRTDGRLVVYCHAPARWLYQQDRYLRGTGAPSLQSRAVAAGLRLLAPPLRRADRWAARRADVYLANSSATAALVAQHYGRDAEVIHPPPAIAPEGPSTPVEGVEPGFALCISRLLSYKHVDLVVAAAARLPGRQFVIVGEGPERAELERGAPGNVVFLGSVDDAVLRWCYAESSVLVAVGFEDFGLTPLEAASFAKPTVARRFGGYLDTIVDQVTGILLDDVTPLAVAEAVRSLADDPPTPSDLEAHAATFGRERFAATIRAAVSRA
jgi:glycosyltransferase involved in cell wall biosynthesis